MDRHKDVHAIPILMDDREPAVMAAALTAVPELRLSKARLPAGDYRVDGRFLIERKTLPGLVAATRSGRRTSTGRSPASASLSNPLAKLTG